MKQKVYFLSFLLITLVFLWGCSSAKRQNTSPDISRSFYLETAIDNLVHQILLSVTENENKKLAILDFSNLDGKITPFGRYLAETLTTKIFQTKKFEIIERRMLYKLIEEQKLSLSGIIDPATAQEVGRIIGAQVIISGTFSDLGDIVKVNARLVSTEKGVVLGVAAVDIIKDEAVRKLLLEENKTGMEETTEKDTGLENNRPLAKIVVYVGDVLPGESGRSAIGAEINVGGSIILTAQGRDDRGNYLPIEPTWRASKPNIVKISPKTGSKVTVKGLAPGTVDIFVEFAGVKRTVEFIFVK